MYPTKTAVQSGARLLAVWGREAFVPVLNWVTFASSPSADIRKIGPIHGFPFDHSHLSSGSKCMFKRPAGQGHRHLLTGPHHEPRSQVARVRTSSFLTVLPQGNQGPAMDFTSRAMSGRFHWGEGSGGS